MIKRLLAPMMVLSLGLVVASCSPFAGYVADHWPHWAGGEPEDLPPRPGAPGYDEFIAHGQANKDSMVPAAAPTAEKTNVQAVANPAAAPAAEKTNVQAAPPANPPADNRAAVEGGLY